MPFVIQMPKLSPTMEEGIITKWLKKEGDFIQSGDSLLEITTDKATMEYPVLDDGYLRKILIPEQSSVKTGECIAIIAPSLEEPIDQWIPQPKPPPTIHSEETFPLPQQEAPLRWKEPSFIPEPPLTQVLFKKHKNTQRIAASPLARAIAKLKNLDLTSVKGTGPNGRITSKDLRLALPKKHISLPDSPPSHCAGYYEEITPSPIRLRIGQRLQEAKMFIPHFYVTHKIRAEALVVARSQLKAMGYAITYNDFIIRASALALRQHPQLNAGYHSHTHNIISFKTVDISIATSITEGVITPIIRFADYKTLFEIAREMKELSTKAKESKLHPHEFKGGSFCISNLGMYGVSSFSAIINPPQGAILAVGAIEKVPLVEDEKIVIGHQLTVTLSCDHRILDGSDAAQFLQTLASLLENPAILMAHPG